MLLLLFLSLAVYIAPKLVFNDSLENWVPPDSEIIHNYQEFLEKFKTDALILISLVDSSNSDHARLNGIVDQLMDTIKQMTHVEKVGKWPPPYLQYKHESPQSIQSFYLTFIPPSHLNPNRPDLVEDLRRLLNSIKVDYHMAGTGVIHEAINDTTSKASLRYLVIGNIMLIILLFIFLRNIRTIIKTVGIALGSVSFLFIMAWLFKIEFNMIMSVLPVLILFYSTSVSIHILNHQGDIKKVIKPTIVAVLTTCAGFGAFLLDTAPVLQDFGFLAICGLAGTLFWAVILFYPKHYNNRTLKLHRERIFKLEKWWNRRTLLIGSVIMLIFLPGVFLIKSEIKSLSILPRNNKIVQDYAFIEENVGPTIPVEYQVDLKKTSTAEVRNWMNTVYKLDEIGAMISYLSIPQLASPRKLGYISEDGTIGRVVFFVPSISTTEGLDLVKRIDQISAEVFTKSQSIPKPTGNVSLYVSVSSHISKSFIKSLLLAFIFVFLIIFIYLRNVKLFLAAILPNVFPVVAMLGVMGWLKIPLDMVTVPMGCLALGIIVDDTVHFLYWYRKTGDLHKTLENAGPGTVITSLIYIIGFSVFLFAEAIPVHYFGILSITAMLSALVGDILILPSILIRMKIKGNGRNEYDNKE